MDLFQTVKVCFVTLGKETSNKSQRPILEGSHGYGPLGWQSQACLLIVHQSLHQAGRRAATSLAGATMPSRAAVSAATAIGKVPPNTPDTAKSTSAAAGRECTGGAGRSCTRRTAKHAGLGTMDYTARRDHVTSSYYCQLQRGFLAVCNSAANSKL